LVIGYLKDMTGSFTAGLVYVVIMLVVGVLCIATVAARARITVTVRTPTTA
jgi:hypothetical protein